MQMPGRHGFATETGTWHGSYAFSIPPYLLVDHRAGNTPLEYVASQTIELSNGFLTGAGSDNYVAYIADSASMAALDSAYQLVGNGYRYGFNGKEKDDEVKGEGNELDYGMRIYDSRAGRFLSVDRLSREYAWNSSYAYAENDVIRSIDLDGLERYVVTNYYNSVGRITKTMITTLTNNQLHRLENMKLVNGTNRITTDDILIRNVGGRGKPFSHRNSFTEREKLVLQKGRSTYPQANSSTASVQFGRPHDAGTPSIESTQKDFPTSQFILEDKSLSYHSAPKNLPVEHLEGTWIGVTSILGPANQKIQNGTLGESAISSVNNIKNHIISDGNVSSININITGVLGGEVNSEADPKFKEYQNGLLRLGNQIKERLLGSGVAEKDIHVNVSAKLGSINNENATLKADVELKK
ncbi:MAG: hypothetical protein H7329_14440 [Opitutaceae bacterium]|nr:hypothetical protein [Cytophagales bacterium]